MYPLVSVIVIFYNTPVHFIREALDSVFAQTYENWEMLLVDDGSDAPITNAALRYAEKYPHKIRFLHHPDHQNLGASAARNLGMQHAQGKYLAFLDADDVWLPEKLEKQVAALEAYPKAGMVYTISRYWYSWTGDPNDRSRDFMPKLGIQPLKVIDPPILQTLFLEGKASNPCPCSILVRRDLTLETGGWVEEFPGLFDDQVFYAKICLHAGVLAMDGCLDYYRRHPQSLTAQAEKEGQIFESHIRYLNWLSGYLSNLNRPESPQYEQLWLTISRMSWYLQPVMLFGGRRKFQRLLMWTKKWLLRVEKFLLPTAIQRRIWKRQPVGRKAVTAPEHTTRA